jgi:hypothetical protein
MFLHIMVVKTQRSQMSRKIHYFFSYDAMLEYTCTKNIYVATYSKMKIYSRKD